MPQPRAGWVRIRVRAFGLNRSELFTRQGHSPNVQFPRVLGIECVGEVDDAGGTDLQVGQRVAALMGEMGRSYDGGYAEYTLVPRDRVLAVNSDLDWATFAAVPETWLTAFGSLFESLQVIQGQRLLIRGGTSSVGMAATALAKAKGVRVLATTRNEGKAKALRDIGADEVIIDTGNIAGAVRTLHPHGVDSVLELVGTVSLRDSLRCVRSLGIVCNTGILGNAWVMEGFEPLLDIPSTVRLTTYHSATTTAAESASALQEIVDGMAAGRYRANLHRVFRLDEVQEAHRLMEDNRATGKLVVVLAP